MGEETPADVLTGPGSHKGLPKAVLAMCFGFLAVVLIPMFFFGGSKKKDDNPQLNQDETPKVVDIKQVAENGYAARIEWGGVPVLHLFETHFASSRNGVGRGAAIAEVWPLEPSVEAALKNFEARSPKHHRQWIEDLHALVLSDRSAERRGGWIPDLVLETQGRNHLHIAAMQRMLLATQLDTFLHVDALAIESTEGPVIAAELSSPIGPPAAQWLTPIVYRATPTISKDGKPMREEDDFFFMLGAFGHSAPIAGINLQGLALLRAPVGYSPEHSIISEGGPDALTQCRAFLARRGDASPSDRGLGRDLITLSETQLITRLSTPSALLAADSHNRPFRYEWSAVGSDPVKSGALEFVQLQTGQTLPMTSQFLSPEKRDANGEAYRSPLASEIKSGATLEQLKEWVQSPSALHGATPVRLVLIPQLRRVLYFASGKLLDLELGKALNVAWRTGAK